MFSKQNYGKREWDLAVHPALDELEMMLRMHKYTNALEPIQVRHPWELEPRHARIVPHPKVLQPELLEHLLEVVREAPKVGDLDEDAPRRWPSQVSM
jgi:hypothetical protein